MAAETTLAMPLASFALEVAAWLVTYALHSTVLLLAALAAFALIGRASRRSAQFADSAPAWRERIGKVALLAGIATASVQTALGLEPFGLRPALVEVPAAPAVVASSAPVVAADVTTARIETHVPETRAERAPRTLLAVPLYLMPVVGALQEAARIATRPTEVAKPAAPDVAAIADPASDGASSRALWILGFVALWAIVASAAFARRFAGWRALASSFDGAEDVTDPPTLALFDELCERAGVARTGPRAAILCVAPLLPAPVTRGVLRPAICIPPRALRDLDRDELAALLGHEIAHAARHDPAWLVVFRLLEVVFCLQPLNRAVARRIEDDAELLCDDRAVVWTGDRLPLASCLTEVASWLVPAVRTPRLAVGMAAHGARLSRRVERLVDDEHEPDAGVRRPLTTVLALAIAASAIAVVPGFAAQRSASPAEDGSPIDVADVEEPADSNALPSLDAPASEPVETAAVETEIEPDAQSDVEPAVEAPADASTAPADSVPAPVAPAPVAESAPGLLASVVALEQPAPLAEVLDELGRELERMRADVRTRKGGAGLTDDLDAIARRIESLRLRETALVAELAHVAKRTNILLSPTSSGRSAEER